MAIHSSTLAWETQWAEEPGGPGSWGSWDCIRVRHNLVTKQQQELKESLTQVHLYVYKSHDHILPYFNSLPSCLLQWRAQFIVWHQEFIF